jgi:hypothetical protein
MKKSMLNLNPLIFALIVSVTLLSGCVGSSTVVQPADPAAGLPPVSGFADDIQDIILPAEMDWNRKKSMTIKTESFRGGVWHYSGKVETISLKDFMTSSMQDNNWKLVGEAASTDIMLAFVKPNKTCMMIISEENFRKTALTLYVTIDKTAAVGLNPFGEAVSE